MSISCTSQRVLPAALLAAATLAGCSGTTDRINSLGAIDYRSEAKQRTLPPLEIPPDLRAPSREDRFEVPTASGQGNSATYSGYSAGRAGAANTANSDILPTLTNVRLDRAGSQRWLVVQAAPEKVWPLVKDFWEQSGFTINLEQREAGFMETEWAENRAKLPQDGVRQLLGRYLNQLYSTGERDKFRIRLERGVQANTTEVYVSHRGMVEVVQPTSATTNATIWQPRPSDPELEAQFLARMMTHLGMDDDRARAAIAADARAPVRAKLVQTSDGGNAVEVQEPFDRAWRRVGLALDRVGFTVEDRDRSKGYYFVRYVDPEVDNASKKEDGLLSKLAFWRKDPATTKAEQYRILVKDEKDMSQVQVLSKDGATESSATAKRILALLQDQLK